jgi:hypothetical protein
VQAVASFSAYDEIVARTAGRECSAAIRAATAYIEGTSANTSANASANFEALRRDLDCPASVSDDSLLYVASSLHRSFRTIPFCLRTSRALRDANTLTKQKHL